MQKVVFHFSRSMGSIKIFFKKCLDIKLLRKKRIFCKVVCSMQIILELQRLVDDLVNFFLELSFFVNALP